VSRLDARAFGKVAVLLGGVSSERAVSLKSGQRALAALVAQGIDAHPFDPREQPLSQLQTAGFARVLNMLHGGAGENGVIQGALDMLGMPYPGTGVLGCALIMDKWRSKLLWQQTGILTPPFEMVFRGDDYAVRTEDIVSRLGLPLFVKPANDGSSIGMSKVHIADALSAAIEKAAQYDAMILVEKSIEGGSEYTASVVGARDLPIIRIVPANEFNDYDAKYLSNETQHLIPCGLAPAEEKRLCALSRRAFEILGGSGWGRIDWMTDRDGHAWFLEANTVPGMTDHSLVPHAAEAAGLDFADLVREILALTLDE
jgi:D-alanine-D-alanine ligase